LLRDGWGGWLGWLDGFLPGFDGDGDAAGADVVRTAVVVGVAGRALASAVPDSLGSEVRVGRADGVPLGPACPPAAGNPGRSIGATPDSPAIRNARPTMNAAASPAPAATAARRRRPVRSTKTGFGARMTYS
jgi:hypothetical protein